MCSAVPLPSTAPSPLSATTAEMQIPACSKASSTHILERSLYVLLSVLLLSGLCTIEDKELQWCSGTNGDESHTTSTKFRPKTQESFTCSYSSLASTPYLYRQEPSMYDYKIIHTTIHPHASTHIQFAHVMQSAQYTRRDTIMFLAQTCTQLRTGNAQRTALKLLHVRRDAIRVIVDENTTANSSSSSAKHNQVCTRGSCPLVSA